MELTYRGVELQHSPVAQVSPGKVGGKYRGLDWRFRHLSKAPVLQTNLDLIYRGLMYQTQPAPAVSEVAAPEEVMAAPIATASPEPLSSVEALARIMMLGHQRALKIRQQSMLERAAEEVGLDADVSGYWNKIQGKVHPSFRESYDRSHATMS